MTIVYGLRNCDTCRKALKWLEQESIAHTFQDIRLAQLDEATIAGWARQAGWEKLLNRRGTTWRSLPETVRDRVDEALAVSLMAQHPALMKRPVIVHPGGVSVGFDEDAKSVLKQLR
jgi:Spx/MgsR family transcriptional regulator